jgi:hypothetical protein
MYFKNAQRFPGYTRAKAQVYFKNERVTIKTNIGLLTRIMKGACISNNLNLIYKILSYKYTKKEIINKHDDIKEIHKNHLEYLFYTAYLSLDNFMLIKKLVPLNYYEIAQEKIGPISKEDFFEMAIENERVDILKYLCDLMQPDNSSMLKLLKESLNKCRYGSASLICSKIKITTPDLFNLVCKIHQRFLTIHEREIIAGDTIYIPENAARFLIDWFKSQVNPDEIENNIIIKNKLNKL